MWRQKAAVIESVVSKCPEKLVSEALTKIGWYLDYSEHELALIENTNHHSSELIEAELKAYVAIKAEIQKLRAKSY